MTVRDSIVSELTQLDARKSRTDKHWNRYFLGIALEALNGFEEDAVKIGTAQAFADRFTPSREMHSIARKLGFPLDVDHGRWILCPRLDRLDGDHTPEEFEKARRMERISDV